jgi:hypothetical protein
MAEQAEALKRLEHAHVKGGGPDTAARQGETDHVARRLLSRRVVWVSLFPSLPDSTLLLREDVREIVAYLHSSSHVLRYR